MDVIVARLRNYIVASAKWLHQHRTLLIYVWFGLSLLGSAAVRVVGIVSGGVLIAAWGIAKMDSRRDG